VNDIANFRMTLDKHHVKVPISALSAGSAIVWGDGEKSVVNYLLSQVSYFDPLRSILSGG
jgi:hypothetical protein